MGSAHPTFLLGPYQQQQQNIFGYYDRDSRSKDWSYPKTAPTGAITVSAVIVALEAALRATAVAERVAASTKIRLAEVSLTRPAPINSVVVDLLPQQIG